MNTSKNYYDLLGVSKTASQDEIKRAYRKLAQKYHPDVNKAADAEAMMKSVNEAYDVLGTPEKRAQYDRFGTSQGYANAQQNPYGNYQGQGTQFTGFEDIFAEILRQQQQQQQYYRQQSNTQQSYRRPRVIRFNPFTIIFYYWIFRLVLNMISGFLSFLFG